SMRDEGSHMRRKERVQADAHKVNVYAMSLQAIITGSARAEIRFPTRPGNRDQQQALGRQPIVLPVVVRCYRVHRRQLEMVQSNMCFPLEKANHISSCLTSLRAG